MQLKYSNSKEVQCYKDFVENPEDRICLRRFSKVYGKEQIKSAIKLHDRLIQLPNAEDYNKLYGNTENRIELKLGTTDREPLVFKVRLTKAYRKFFNQITDEDDSLLLKKDWKGVFSEITTIYIVDINKHKYKK